MPSFILQDFCLQLLTVVPPLLSSNLQLCSAAFCAHVMGEGRKQEPPCWFPVRQDQDRYARTGGGCRWTRRPSSSWCWAPSPCSHTGCRSWRHWMISLSKQKISVAEWHWKLTGMKLLDVGWHPKFSILQIMQHSLGINIIERWLLK